jgi:hypothetical protein
LLFRSEFRQEYQAQHPGNKSVAAVSHLALYSPPFFFSLCVCRCLIFKCWWIR